MRELQRTGSFMMEKDLAWGTAGNISAKVNDEQYLISASGSYLGLLQDDDLVLCPKKKFNGKRPSKETPMHEAVYSERKEIKAILHASPFYSTVIACSKLEIPSDLFVETMYYLERVTRVRYEHPGSLKLAEAVREKAKDANILLLENHGVLVYDVSIKEALMSLQTLEYAAKMLITTIEKGIEINRLPGHVTKDFLNNAGYKQRREWSL
ncbi:L-fuculose-phosphate aldolase [Evansella vedderi]|uniref:L-fuculose-phosphate aldolase n=1 Tax=Evansella vedderi TaxID=38282 RepID=A0ABT9ZPU8_9BACI|nr:class II aldolase/adducin family protein [Evansella vedderi]MDQ0253266.1 L-fuculose-phosphate aldolase [Evansella vedderi]